MSLERRFWSKVEKTDGCWLWTASTSQGYGRIWTPTPDGGRMLAQAHRVAYELLVGPIPDGLYLDHLCRNRLCVRPDHLEPVTNGENVLRGKSGPAENARKTHCIAGHPFDEKNTRYSAGKRWCRACAARRQRELKARRRAAA